MNPILNKLLTLLSPQRRMEFLVVDRDFKILEASWGVQRFADSPNQVLQGNDVRLGFPEIVGFEDILIDIIQEKQSNLELKGIARSLDQNHPLYIDIFIVSDQDQQTRENRLIILFEDVTEKMVLQQNLVQRANETSLLASALIESKNYVDKVIEAMTEVLLITTNSGNIKKVNQAAQDLFGYSEWELITQPISKIIADKNFLSQAKQNAGSLLFRNVELICYTKNRGDIYVEFSCTVIETDIEDFPDFMYVGREIVDRKRAEATS